MDHATPTPGDPTVGGWSGPGILGDDPAPYIYEDVDFVVQTDGTMLDFTPVDHGDGYAGGNYRDDFTTPYGVNPADVAYANVTGYAHGTDYGSSRKSSYDVPPFQAHDERYLSTRFEGVGQIELPTIVGGQQRGLNGSAVNNPPLEMYGGRGYRYGWVEQSWVDRKMYDPTRTHDERMVLPNVATVGANQPVPSAAGPYNSPFDSLARIIRNVQQKPTLRRQPPPINESITDDGSFPGYADESPDWVVG